MKTEAEVQPRQGPRSPSEKLQRCMWRFEAWFEATEVPTAAWPVNSQPAGHQPSAFVMLPLPGFLRFIGRMGYLRELLELLGPA